MTKKNTSINNFLILFLKGKQARATIELKEWSNSLASFWHLLFLHFSYALKKMTASVTRTSHPGFWLTRQRPCSWIPPRAAVPVSTLTKPKSNVCHVRQIPSWPSWCPRKDSPAACRVWRLLGLVNVSSLTLIHLRLGLTRFLKCFPFHVFTISGVATLARKG